MLLIPGLLSRHTHACVCTRAKRYPPLPSSLALAIPGYLSTWTPSSFCWPSHFPVETPSSSHQATPPPHHHILFTLHKLWYPALAYPSARMPFHLPQTLTPQLSLLSADLLLPAASSQVCILPHATWSQTPCFGPRQPACL